MRPERVERKKIKLPKSRPQRMDVLRREAGKHIKRSRPDGVVVCARRDGSAVWVVNADEEARLRDVLTLAGFDVEVES